MPSYEHRAGSPKLILVNILLTLGAISSHESSIFSDSRALFMNWSCVAIVCVICLMSAAVVFAATVAMAFVLYKNAASPSSADA